jgi:hypothetical protein
MTTPAFALHLGGGVYVDSNGEIYHGQTPATPIIYEDQFALPIDFKAAAEQLKSFNNALKSINEGLKDANTAEVIHQLASAERATPPLKTAYPGFRSSMERRIGKASIASRSRPKSRLGGAWTGTPTGCTLSWSRWTPPTATT